MIDESSTDDEAILAWEALGFARTARCEILPSPAGCAVVVWWGDEMLVAEMTPDFRAADARADVFRSALVRQGWTFFEEEPGRID